MIPDYQDIMLPLLKFASDGCEHCIEEAIDELASEFHLSIEEKERLLPNGQEEVFASRVRQASTEMKKDGLLDSTKKGFFWITPRGQEILRENPIDAKSLKKALKESDTEKQIEVKLVYTPKDIYWKYKDIYGSFLKNLDREISDFSEFKKKYTNYDFVSESNYDAFKKALEKYSRRTRKESDTYQSKPDSIIESIERGESSELEFKSTLRINLHTGEKDDKITHEVLKTIAAFLNTRGGTLLIGVSDNGKILGIDNDKFKNPDRFLLHFGNLLKKYIGPQFNPEIRFNLVELEGKKILRIKCIRARDPVYLQFRGEEQFFIRHGPSNISLSISEAVNYIIKWFTR